MAVVAPRTPSIAYRTASRCWCGVAVTCLIVIEPGEGEALESGSVVFDEPAASDVPDPPLGEEEE